MAKEVELASEESSYESHDFSVAEENMIYYAAGYVIQRLEKFAQSSNNDMCVYIGALYTWLKKTSLGPCYRVMHI